MPSPSARDPLTCRDMVARLEDYVDRNLGPDEIRRVEDHLAGCFECAREYRFETVLLEGIRQRLRRIALPPGLMRAVQARLDREEGTKPRREAL